MNQNTLLLRQVHPSFIQGGQITSQVFRPTPKDENMLSAYNGDLITPEDSWKHYTGAPNNYSIGVMAVSKEECGQHELPVVEDGEPFPEHVSIDYTGKAKPLKINKLFEHAKSIGNTYKAHKGLN